MSMLEQLYHMDTSEMITILCRGCSGRRHLGAEICSACNGEGVTYIRRRDPRKVVLRNLGMLCVVLVGIAAGILVFT